ncbi:MAG: tRNA-guanine transglycosylase, partial [Planctomycetales bacterium]|nr:tRNA-guanine transglycosylase [Planctomycetales bacterium]
ALFGIVQGGLDAGLRAACAREIAGMPFDGFALGGLGVGEPASTRDPIVAATAPLLPADRARYLMGIGGPSDLVASAALGVDLFDCVLPTRNGRNGEVFTREGTLRLRNAAHARDPRPLDMACACACCRGFSRGALRHLFMADEMLGPILASLHNVTFTQDLMAEVRAAIPRGDLLRVAALARRAEEPA